MPTPATATATPGPAGVAPMPTETPTMLTSQVCTANYYFCFFSIFRFYSFDFNSISRFFLHQQCRHCGYVLQNFILFYFIFRVYSFNFNWFYTYNKNPQDVFTIMGYPHCIFIILNCSLEAALDIPHRIFMQENVKIFI